jgi:pyridoxal phosphate enzyme (YggS family)
MSRLQDNLAEVRGRVAAAAGRSGRAAGSITLVAVTKYVRGDVVRELIASGCYDLGEARPQELWAKARALRERPSQYQSDSSDVRWHLVGHLQRNKVSQTLPHVALIHSADSLRLLKAIDSAAAEQQRRVNVLIEVNVSGDVTKHGFEPAGIAPVLPHIAALSHVQVRGLMCMAAREGDTAVARANFAALRELRDRLSSNLPPNLSFDELSMGMSGDFEIAIEEGATMVRVGSALFQGVT